jgi:UDP-N-acetylglucosamine 2-epimerase (non-hydrolysing)
VKITLVASARTNFMKISPIVREFKRIGFRNFDIVHTGQHYVYKMSMVFFNELEIPKPDYSLNVGSGTHADQTSKVMIEFEKVCIAEKPDVVVVGDANSIIFHD